jgi:hypothetical protein
MFLAPGHRDGTRFMQKAKLMDKVKEKSLKLCDTPIPRASDLVQTCNCFKLMHILDISQSLLWVKKHNVLEDGSIC